MIKCRICACFGISTYVSMLQGTREIGILQNRVDKNVCFGMDHVWKTQDSNF